MRIRFGLTGSAVLLCVAVGFCVACETTRVGAAETVDPPKLVPVSGEAFAAIGRFYEYDRTIPLQARVVERKEDDAAVREKIVFRGVRGFLVPGTLEMPKNRNASLPLVLLLHGWSGNRSNWWTDGGYISGGNMRKALVDEGYAVLALDAQAHGERMAENDYAMVNDFKENGVPTHRNYFTLDEIVTQTVREYRRALDYVATRDSIDSGRVGMVGYSMGGIQTFVLTAVEPRIRVSVACVTPSMVGSAGPISPKDYAQGAGDRPFLMLMGKDDSMCAEAHARQLLALIPSSRKQLIFYDAGHKLPASYVDDALAWLKKHL